jgi:EAL domain-containing protein (putative c-di-GMP-specific phosphodiesterase class I)
MGWSALGLLSTLPPSSALKVDRSLTLGMGKDPGSEAILASVVQLGAALGLDVIAEGVETEIQREQLARMGCPHGQGYLFGRPQPLAP